ncbi:MAG: hypothetical protein H7A33_01305 [Deltaproteobacteria bacterium]|nr:hypothetical protein [Deltaproteobacteria bacterium]
MSVLDKIELGMLLKSIPLKEKKPERMLALVEGVSQKTDLKLREYIGLDEIKNKIKSDLLDATYSLDRHHFLFSLKRYSELALEIEGLEHYLASYPERWPYMARIAQRVLIAVDLPLVIRKEILNQVAKDNLPVGVVENYSSYYAVGNLIDSLSTAFKDKDLDLLGLLENIGTDFRDEIRIELCRSVLSEIDSHRLALMETEAIHSAAKLAWDFGCQESFDSIVTVLNGLTTDKKITLDKLVQIITELVDVPVYKSRNEILYHIEGDSHVSPNALNEEFIRKLLDWQKVKDKILRDLDRQAFWSDYWHQIDDFEIHYKSKIPYAVGMRFNNFWVVEKSESGAVYIFNDYRYKLDEVRAKEFTDYKSDMSARMTHQGKYWQSRMSTVLNLMRNTDSVDQLRKYINRF